MEDILTKILDKEDEKTIALFLKFPCLKKQGFVTKEQFIEIAKWKSSRPLKHYEANDERIVKEVTGIAFATKNEKIKIHILTALKGVNYPTASAILMFYDQVKYPVLDIRVWQQLYKAKLVDTNEKGQNFTLEEWKKYLEVIREKAKEFGLTARQVEKRLFDYDKSTRSEKLY